MERISEQLRFNELALEFLRELSGDRFRWKAERTRNGIVIHVWSNSFWGRLLKTFGICKKIRIPQEVQ